MYLLRKQKTFCYFHNMLISFYWRFSWFLVVITNLRSHLAVRIHTKKRFMTAIFSFTPYIQNIANIYSQFPINLLYMYTIIRPLFVDIYYRLFVTRYSFVILMRTWLNTIIALENSFFFWVKNAGRTYFFLISLQPLVPIFRKMRIGVKEN